MWIERKDQLKGGTNNGGYLKWIYRINKRHKGG